MEKLPTVSRLLLMMFVLAQSRNELGTCYYKVLPKSYSHSSYEYLLSIAHICIISKLNNCCQPVARFQTVNVKRVKHHHASCTILLPSRYGLSVSSAEYSVCLVGVNRVSACREFCGVHSWGNGTRFRDGVKLLWCHSHLVQGCVTPIDSIVTAATTLSQRSNRPNMPGQRLKRSKKDGQCSDTSAERTRLQCCNLPRTYWVGLHMHGALIS